MNKRLWGILLIVLGGLALLQGTGQYDFGLSFWPVVLAVIGISITIGSLRRWPPRWFGLAVGLYAGSIGVLNILHDAGVTSLDGQVVVEQTWPILLVAVGVSILFGGGSIFINFGHRGRHGYRMVGDMRYGQEPWRLDKDLTMEHGVGDVKLDLTTAEITDGEHRIRIKGGIGDMVVRVPDNVTVTVNAKTGIGDMVVLGDHRSGLGLSLSKEQVVSDSVVHIKIDAAQGIGNLRVIASPPVGGRLVL